MREGGGGEGEEAGTRGEEGEEEEEVGEADGCQGTSGRDTIRGVRKDKRMRPLLQEERVEKRTRAYKRRMVSEVYTNNEHEYIRDN